MVHVGKFYPYWQSTRLLTAADTWPALGPTEYSYTFLNQTGPGASGIVASGRGLLPNLYHQGDTIWTYQGNVGSYLGQPYELCIDYSFNSGNIPLSCNLRLLWGGVEIGTLFAPITTAGNYGGTIFPTGWTGWNAAPLAPITNILLRNLAPVPWTAVPPPPAPHIF